MAIVLNTIYSIREVQQSTAITLVNEEVTALHYLVPLCMLNLETHVKSRVCRLTW